MTSLPGRLTFGPEKLRCPGEYMTNSQGDFMINLGDPSSGNISSETAVLRFSLPRSTTSSKGTRINSINVMYGYTMNPFTSVTANLRRIQYGPNPTYTNIATTNSFNTGLGVQPINTPLNFIGTVTVNVPTFDNANAPVAYELSINFSNVNAYPANITFAYLYGVEVLYTGDFVPDSS
jgi:hypothetical protein